jgi:hypothetical protein
MKRYIPWAIVIFSAVTVIALRAAGWRPAATPGMTDIAGLGTANPPGTPGAGPDSSAEQMNYIFHELHADGRHALCAICG